jgi:uncharacterized protein (DUF1499 family)
VHPELPIVTPSHPRSGDYPSTRPSGRFPLLLRLGVLVVLVAVITIALAGLGSRWGLWPFRTGFALLRWGGYAALAGAALSVAGALVDRPWQGRSLAVAGALAVLAIATVAVPWSWRRTASRVPAIHDITTDTERPPEFAALRELRPGARNPVEYGGPEVAAKQRAAYPDLAPAMLPVPPLQALTRATSVAQSLGWEVVAVDTTAGLLEATDRTLWFGFYDDVVVRVTPAAGGSRVDARSLSRVGGSDVGTNAKRLRRFLAALKADG